MKAPIGVFGRRWGFSVSERHWQQSRASAKRTRQKKTGRKKEEVRALPISALLTRIRKLIPRRHDKHYEEIVRGLGNGALRASATPMSDRELSRAIAEFLRDAPSVDSVSALGRRLDPTSRR
jgi:hypothetical protein